MEDISSSFRPRMLPYPTVTYIPCLEATPILYHQHASPLVEVFSVWIHNDVDNRHIPRKIAGKVYVVDEFENSFTLYDRRHEDFETVGGPNGDGTLSLHDPHCDDPASSHDDGGGVFGGLRPGPDPRYAIGVDLRDILHGKIVQGTLTTSYVSPDCYGKPCVTRFHFATVYWTTLRAAALATVSISYAGDQDSLRGVYGSLFAYYGDYYGRFCKPDEEKYFRITLFDKPKHEPAAEIQRDALLDLTRSVLAVPAHSSVVIEGCLWDADDKLIGIKAEFPVQTCGDNSLVLEDRIKVGVRFELSPDTVLDGLSTGSMEDISSTFRPSDWGMPSSSSSDDSTAESECKLLSVPVQTLKVIKCRKTAEIAHYGDIVNQHTKRPLELMSAVTSSSESTANTHIGKPSSGFLVKPLIEVFSVSLDIAHMECSVRGTVKIDDMNCLYDRYFGSTESVLSYGSISLKRGCLIAADTEFCLKIDLRECSKSFNLGKGDIKLSKSEIEKYWNKHLCSVVKGEFGFVAVHYSPIKAALAAHVTVKFGCDGSTGTGKIYGSIVALYGGCADSTFHDKEYFRSRIFNRGPRSDEEDLEVNGDSPISVVTSTVAVPEGSSLIIQGSLHVGEKMNVYLEVDIFPDLCKSSRTIVGQNCYAEVSVMWELRNDEVVGLATGAEIVEEDIYGGTHVFGAPMVEVFSVRIRSCSEDTERPFDIYGQIRLTSGPDVFSIYNRDHWHSQIICQDGFLNLSGPHNLGSSYAGIMAVGPLSISMNLRDTICDTECTSNFNYSLLDGAKYDKGQSATSDFATLYWAVIRVAVLATVEVSIAKWGEVDDGDIQVYGSVIADYGNNYHYQLSCPPGEEQNFRIALFDVPKSHPVPMIVGYPMRLSRYVVAVPSCSSLVVKADLWDGVSDSRIIHGKIAEFLACHKGTCTKSYRGIIQVKVTWDHRPSDIFPSTHGNPYMTEALENIDEVHQLEIVRRQYGKITEKIGELRSPPLKIVRGPHGKVDDGKNMKIRELQCPPLHISQVSCGSHVPELSGCPQLEVFSIFVGGIDKNCKVYGTATVSLGFENILLYSRTKDDAELVSPYGTISMGFGHEYLIDGLDTFSMFIELKDVDDDDVAMVRGWIGMDFMELERRFYKRLCSIVRGPRCYAAVHYTTFCSAKGASLWVKFVPAQTSSDTMSVYGHLMAHYGGGLYSYDEPYAKAYYRITLFDRLGEDMAQVMADDGSIPLLKSLVAVPVVQKTSLVVWGYLFFCSAANGTIAEAPIHVEMWPQPDDVTNRVELEGRNCSLEVGVKWVFW